MKKNIKRTLVGILIILMFFTINISYAATLTADSTAKEIYDAYEKNKTIFKSISSEELLENFKEKVANEEKAFANIINSIAPEVDPFGTTRKMYEEDQEKYHLCLEAIKDRINKLEVDSNKENGTGQTNKELSDYSYIEIYNWLKENSPEYLSNEVKAVWKNTIENDTQQNANSKQYLLNILNGMDMDEAYESIYVPSSTTGSSTGILGQSSTSGNHTIDEVIEGGKNFIEAGKNQQSKIDGTNLQTASDTLYNMLLSIGIVIAVIVGIYLGIKFMISSAEDKAKVKESLIPYIAGCVVIFGAFIIWKLVILLLNGIA